jgi:hypothetical protein
LGEAVSVVVVAAAFTLWVSVEEVLPPNPVTPWYTAVIERDPAASAAVSNVAWPAALSVPVPICAPEFRNDTVPDGVPVADAAGVTVAVNVVACPNALGLTDDVTAVVVDAVLIVCDTLDEVLAPKLVSPAYTALIE